MYELFIDNLSIKQVGIFVVDRIAGRCAHGTGGAGAGSGGKGR
jgi:hypothetical protein